MVIKTTSPKSTYVNTSSCGKSTSNCNMEVQMQKITNYFDTIDGSPNALDKAEPALREAFHPDLVIEAGDRELLFDDLIDLVRHAVKNGCYADLNDISDNKDGTVTMAINNHLPGEKGDVTRQVAYFRDGKVVRVHAVGSDAQQFGAVIDRLSFMPSQAVAEKYRSMVACFDGSPDAYSKAEPIIDEIIDQALVIVHDCDNCIDFAGFKEWAATYACERNVAAVENIELTDDGFRAVIRNIVDGVDQGPVEQVGVVNNGKIVHWSATPTHGESFNTLIKSVSDQGTEGKIKRLRDYLLALDGTPDAWENFEPHIDRVLAPDVIWEDGSGRKMKYDEIVAFIRDQYIPNGCYAILECVEDNGDGSLTVVINNHLPGEGGDPTLQTLYYGSDGLLHRLTSASLFATCKRVADLSYRKVEAVAKKYKDFLNALSPINKVEFMRLFEELFSQDLVFVTGGGNLDKESYKHVLVSSINGGYHTCNVKVDVVSRDQILIEFDYIAEGRPQWHVERVVTVFEGAVIYVRPTCAEADTFHSIKAAFTSDFES